RGSRKTAPGARRRTSWTSCLASPGCWAPRPRSLSDAAEQALDCGPEGGRLLEPREVPTVGDCLDERSGDERRRDGRGLRRERIALAVHEERGRARLRETAYGRLALEVVRERLVGPDRGLDAHAPRWGGGLRRVVEVGRAR